MSIPYEIRAGVEALVAANNHRTTWRGHWHTEQIGGYLCRFERTAEGWKFYDSEKLDVVTHADMWRAQKVAREWVW